MAIKIAEIIEIQTDPVNKTMSVDVLGHKGICSFAQILPLEGSTDAKKIIYMYYRGMELALGLPLSEIKSYLQTQATALQDFINNMPEEV
jgi:hypothetical protein